MLKVYYDKYLLKIQYTHVQCSLIKQQTKTMNVITFQKLNDILNLRGLETIFQNFKTFEDLKKKKVLTCSKFNHSNPLVCK